MGSSVRNVNAFFGIMTMIIAVPTGVKVFDWLLHDVSADGSGLRPPMLWTHRLHRHLRHRRLVSGVLLAIPPLDYRDAQRRHFFIAHFHNMLIPGVLIRLSSPATPIWFPKAMGFQASNHDLGARAPSGFGSLGSIMAFMPLYVPSAFMGMPRRMETL